MTRPKRSYASKRSSSLVSPGTKTSVPYHFSPLRKKPFNINDDHIVRDHLAEKAESSDEEEEPEEAESSVFSDRESVQGSEAEGSEDGRMSDFHDIVDRDVVHPVSESIVSVRNAKNSDNKYVVITKVKKRKEKAESTSCSETDTEMMEG